MNVESIVIRWPFSFVHLRAKEGAQSNLQSACAVFSEVVLRRAAGARRLRTSTVVARNDGEGAL